MIVITGATSGIGRSLALKYAESGNNLVVTGRDTNAMESLLREIRQYNVKVKYIICDLSTRSGVEKLIDFIDSMPEIIDIFVNNAGLGYEGDFSESLTSISNQIIDVNISALTALTHYAVKRMKKDDYGQILNVASIVGVSPIPNMAVYSASKAYVRNFSFAISNELRDCNVSIHVLSPGTTDSKFFERAKSNRDAKSAMTCDEVAEIAISGLTRNAFEIIPGIQNKLLVAVMSIIPSEFMMVLTRKFMK